MENFRWSQNVIYAVKQGIKLASLYAFAGWAGRGTDLTSFSLASSEAGHGADLFSLFHRLVK